MRIGHASAGHTLNCGFCPKLLMGGLLKICGGHLRGRLIGGLCTKYTYIYIYKSPERPTTCCQGAASGSLRTQSPGHTIIIKGPRGRHKEAAPKHPGQPTVRPICTLAGSAPAICLFVFFLWGNTDNYLFWICAPHGANSHWIVHSYGHYRYAGFCTCSVCFEPSSVRGTWGRDSVRFSWCVFTQSQPGIRQISFTQSDKQYFSSGVSFFFVLMALLSVFRIRGYLTSWACGLPYIYIYMGDSHLMLMRSPTLETRSRQGGLYKDAATLPICTLKNKWKLQRREEIPHQPFFLIFLKNLVC